MSVFADCREGRDLARHRVFCAGRGCGGAYLTCLLALVGLCRIGSTAAADSGAPPAVAGDTAPFERTMSWLSKQAENSAVPARPARKPKAEKTGNSQGLVTETEKPEDYRKIAAASLYPPTDSPQKLTLEQLEAIAKLAPRKNNAGMQVHPAMVPLFRSMILNYSGGTYKNTPIRFRLHTPEPYRPGKKYPLVVWLHGAGECGSDNINQLSHLHHIIPCLVGPKKRDFFLLVPQCPHSHVAWEAPEICSTRIRADGSVECHVTDDPVARGNAPLAFTLAMVEAVMKQFPIDPNRVTVAGLSTGGEGTWRILERRPDLFAAAVPLVSWQAMHDKSLREKPLLKKVPIWAVYSSDDHGIDFARKEFERMKDRGCRVYKTEFGVCGHRAWTPAMLQGDIFGWLISRAKDGERFFVAEPSPTDPEKIGIFADVTEGDLKREPTKAAARPKPAAEADKQALSASIMQKAREAFERAKELRARLAPERLEEGVGVAPRIAGTVRGSVEPSPNRPAVAVQQPRVEELRLELVARYLTADQIEKALAVADKVKNRERLVEFLLQRRVQPQVLDYIDRELDRMEQRGETSRTSVRYHVVVGIPVSPKASQPPRPAEEPLKPIPAGKKSPKDECGKEWAMSSTTEYGLFPNGWDQEAAHVPGYIVNETGKQLRDRLAKAFADNDLPAMKEFCESFIRLDDVPLSSPWFDTSGGRLQGRIKYTLNEKAKPVVALLRDIAGVKAESKKDFAELAQKALKRIDAITHPKEEKTRIDSSD
jgi:pimeloyl-ACP methyl ester carboxylesterase